MQLSGEKAIFQGFLGLFQYNMKSLAAQGHIHLNARDDTCRYAL